jgi:hypothetical protein
MTILIHAINDQVIAYPATLDALRQEFPNCSFPVEPTAEDLAPFNRFFVAPIPAPSCDPRTERAEHTPTLTDKGWQQTWTIRPATTEEITAYDIANAPEPDWMGFGIELTSNQGITDLYAGLPGPVSNGLSIGLNEAGKGDPRLFAGLWQRALAAGAIQPELLTDIADLAVQYHLPEPFITGLDPATPDVDEAWA